MRIEVKTKFNIRGGTAGQVSRQTARGPKPGKSPEKKQREKKPRREKRPIAMPDITLPHIALPKIQVPHFKVPRFRLGGKRAVFGALVPLALLGIVLSAWLGVNLWKHAVPKPLFTEAGLQALPPAGTNGCLLLYDEQVAGEYAGKDLGDVNMFRNAAAIEAFLDAARDEYAFAKSTAGRDDVKKMVDLYREIMKKPAFADAVMPDARSTQKVLVFMALHNSLTAAAISRMQEKKYGAALQLMRDQLSLNAQYIGSARSMTNYITALNAYDKSLAILKSMLGQPGPNGTVAQGSPSTCREIAGSLRSFNARAVSLAPIVQFEYVLSWKNTFSPEIEHPEAAAYRTMKRRALVFFDRGLTQKWNDERWKQLYEIAKSPNDIDLLAVNRILEKRYAAGRFWWFHNAVGKKYLDSLQLPVSRLFAESKNLAASVALKQNEVLSLLEAPVEEKRSEQQPAKKRTGKPAGKKR